MPPDQALSFGAWIKHQRARLNLTQEAAAERVGCAAQTLRAFENGLRRPSRGMAERLAEVLQVPAEQREAFLRMARGMPPAATAAPPTPPPARPALLSLPNLPAPPTPLIGRASELAAITAHLTDPACRLLTILGPGGIGKTHLALQVAADLAQSTAFADGVAWVNLAPVENAGTVATTIAGALGLDLHGAATPEEYLPAALVGRELLLILDNLEHLPESTSLLARMMQDVPGVTMLITSRARLGLPGEWVVELDGLRIPRSDAEVLTAPAALLFLARARQVDHRFALTPDTAPAVRRICDLLEGMPLGIELAAAWVRVLSLADIAADLARGIDVLVVPGRADNPRHASLRTVFDHSWQRLTATEQGVLARLAIFRGNAQREAIAAVCNLPPGVLLAQLGALVDRSLVRVVHEEPGTTRYRLHELVRQYAAEQLATDPAAEAEAYARHAAYYAAWTGRQEPALFGADQKAAVSACLGEIDNLRAAWQWGVRARDAALLLQMTYSLFWVYELRGWFVEGAVMFGQGAAALQPYSQRADASTVQQVACWVQVAIEGWFHLRNDPARGRALLTSALEPLRRLGDPKALFHCVGQLGFLALFAGDYTHAQALFEEALAAARRISGDWALSAALVMLGGLEVQRGNFTVARLRLQEGLAIARRAGEVRVITTGLENLGALALALDQPEEAERAYRECLILSSKYHDRYGLGKAFYGLGAVAHVRGHHDEARYLLQEGLALARESCNRWLETDALVGLARVLAAQGQAGAARALLQTALSVAADGAPLPFALDALAALVDFELARPPRDAVLVALAYLCRHARTRPPTRAQAAQRWEGLTHQVDAARLAAAQQHAATLAPERPAALLELLTDTAFTLARA